MVLFFRAGGTGGKDRGQFPPPISVVKLTLFQVMNFNDAFISVLRYLSNDRLRNWMKGVILPSSIMRIDVYKIVYLGILLHKQACFWAEL